MFGFFKRTSIHKRIEQFNERYQYIQALDKRCAKLVGGDTHEQRLCKENQMLEELKERLA
jgi:uncharacterized protein YaaN involved in tellurite resistance